jgi:hypothetical protein
LRDQLSSIHQTGAELIVIGNGKPHHAEAFRLDLEMSTPLYVDQNLGTYQALKLRRSIWATFNPMVWITILRAIRAGFRIEEVKGDLFQQGGTFVVLPNGDVPYHHINKNTGDIPPWQDFLEVLRKAHRKSIGG